MAAHEASLSLASEGGSVTAAFSAQAYREALTRVYYLGLQSQGEAAGTRALAFAEPLSASEWNHIAISIEKQPAAGPDADVWGGKIAVYINSVFQRELISSDFFAKNWWFNYNHIGKGRQIGDGQAFSGWMDDFRVYSRVLTTHMG